MSNIEPSEVKPQLCTDYQAATILGVSRSKIWAMVRAGTLTPVELPPRCTRFRIDQLDAIVRG